MTPILVGAFFEVKNARLLLGLFFLQTTSLTLKSPLFTETA